MCWIETKDNINVQIANKDFKVYKIVSDANKQFCKSIVMGFDYIVDTLYTIPIIEYYEVFSYKRRIIKIKKAYHSYTGIHFLCNSSYYISGGSIKYKDLLFGKIKVSVPFENKKYIATFIIPKGSTYIINTKGEIISDKIIYTGRYLKLQIMCWIENRDNLDIQIADKDIEVYKVVLEADKQSCISCVQGFIYEANTLYKMPSIEIGKTYIGGIQYISNIVCIEKAYHSYTKVQYTLKQLDEKYCPHKYKGLIVGNLSVSIKFDNSYYVATFIIPKGSQYTINWKGEIISNQIMYTGKYLKL